MHHKSLSGWMEPKRNSLPCDVSMDKVVVAAAPVAAPPPPPKQSINPPLVDTYKNIALSSPCVSRPTSFGSVNISLPLPTSFPYPVDEQANVNSDDTYATVSSNSFNRHMGRSMRPSGNFPTDGETMAVMGSSIFPADQLMGQLQQNMLNIRQMNYGRRRSLSNQTISISNASGQNEIYLKASMSDQNLIVQNNFGGRGGGQNQMMFTSSGNGTGGSNIMISNESYDPLSQIAKSTLIQSNGSNSMICMNNAANSSNPSMPDAEFGTGMYKRSRHALLPKLPVPNACNVADRWFPDYNRHQFQQKQQQQPYQQLYQQQPQPELQQPGTVFGGDDINKPPPMHLDAFQMNEAFHERPKLDSSRTPPIPIYAKPDFSGSSSSNMSAGEMHRRQHHHHHHHHHLQQQQPNIKSSHVRGPTMRPQDQISRSHSLVSGDKIIDIDYDSDTGWKRAAIRSNLFPSAATAEHDNHPIKGGLQTTKTSHPNPFDAMPKKVRGKYILNEWRSEDGGGEAQMKDKSKEVKPPRRHRIRSGSSTAERSKRDAAGADLNFPEYDDKRRDGEGSRGRKSGSAIAKSTNRQVIAVAAADNAVDKGNADSIKSIIDEVRTELLAKPKQTEYLSDESANNKATAESGESNKFEKCISRTSSCALDDVANLSEEGSDDVFVSEFTRGRNSSFSGDMSKKSRLPKRRTSSLEDLAKFRSGNVAHKSDPMSHSRRHGSSVSINEKPKIHSYDKHSKTNVNDNSIASKSNAKSIPSPIASASLTPKRGSLKKPTPKTASKSSPKSPTSKSSTKSCSKTGSKSPKRSGDYDPRDRRRDGNGTGNGREVYRHRDRDRDRDRDRGELSDREQKDSQNNSFNRSLSNTEGTPEDKIGKSGSMWGERVLVIS